MPAFFLLLAVVVFSATTARADPLAEELLRLEQERQAAYVAGDRAVLERHFADEYVHTNLNGGRTNRDEELAFFAPGRFSVEKAEISGVSARRYGDVATMIGVVVWEGATYRPAPTVEVDLSGAFSVSRVYVRRDGRWRLALSHASRLPAPPPNPQ